MFRWFKTQLVTWLDEKQRGEVARLQQKAMRLKTEVERKTGKPIQLTPEQRRLLAEKAKGLDPETIKQISVFDPEHLSLSDHDTDPAENH
ncbi:MAG: hypothetical protein P8N76_08035 [Pirellulaceae bacterium]|nr:hypothetical protein [Pirellulaceae bacterium]